MSLRLYMDVHVRAEVTNGLRRRRVDVLTAQEDGSEELEDPQLLDRASQLGCVLFTQDADFLALAATRQRNGTPFSGIIYAHQLAIAIGQCIDDLELLAKVYEPDEMVSRLVRLPLK